MTRLLRVFEGVSGGGGGRQTNASAMKRATRAIMANLGLLAGMVVSSSVVSGRGEKWTPGGLFSKAMAGVALAVVRRDEVAAAEEVLWSETIAEVQREVRVLQSSATELMKQAATQRTRCAFVTGPVLALK